MGVDVGRGVGVWVSVLVGLRVLVDVGRNCVGLGTNSVSVGGRVGRFVRLGMGDRATIGRVLVGSSVSVDASTVSVGIRPCVDVTGGVAVGFCTAFVSMGLCWAVTLGVVVLGVMRGDGARKVVTRISWMLTQSKTIRIIANTSKIRMFFLVSMPYPSQPLQNGRNALSHKFPSLTFHLAGDKIRAA